MSRSFSIIVYICVSCLLLHAAAKPQRSQGISIHMLPKRVADKAGKPWGLTVDYSPRLKSELTQPVLQTSSALLSYVRKQNPEVQENGVWIVITNPHAYSSEEKALLDEVIALCQRENILLFVCRASELPSGWKRYD